jgi:hypothetical protein
MQAVILYGRLCFYLIQVNRRQLMSIILITLAVAFIVILVALALLAIGWLVTGKSKIRPGACGRDPNQFKENQDCGNTGPSCYICKKPEEKKDDNLP